MVLVNIEAGTFTPGAVTTSWSATLAQVLLETGAYGCVNIIEHWEESLPNFQINSTLQRQDIDLATDCDIMWFPAKPSVREGRLGKCFQQLHLALSGAFLQWEACRFGMPSYRTFQAAGDKACECKYEYTGTTKHHLFPCPSDEKDVIALGCHAPYPPEHFPRCLAGIFYYMEQLTGLRTIPTNHIVCNRYQTNQYIPMHSDNENLSGKRGGILSISIGSPAVFVIKWGTVDKQTEYDKMLRWYPDMGFIYQVAIILKHGDIFAMSGSTQDMFQHGTDEQATRLLLQTGLAPSMFVYMPAWNGHGMHCPASLCRQLATQLDAQVMISSARDFWRNGQQGPGLP